MSQSCNYGCAELPDHQIAACSDYKNGGISAAAFLECDYATVLTDFTSASEWNAAIAAGKVKLVLNIKGEVPAAAPVQVDNPIGRGAAQIMIGLDNTLTFMDKNVNVTNDEFYAKSNLRKLYVALYNSDEDEIRVSTEPVVITALPVAIPNNPRELQGYQLTGAFFTDAGIIPFELYDAPVGIFE